MDLGKSWRRLAGDALSSPRLPKESDRERGGSSPPGGPRHPAAGVAHKYSSDTLAIERGRSRDAGLGDRQARSHARHCHDGRGGLT